MRVGNGAAVTSVSAFTDLLSHPLCRRHRRGVPVGLLRSRVDFVRTHGSRLQDVRVFETGKLAVTSGAEQMRAPSVLVRPREHVL